MYHTEARQEHDDDHGAEESEYEDERQDDEHERNKFFIENEVAETKVKDNHDSNDKKQ